MRHLVQWILSCGLVIGLPALAQQAAPAAGYRPGSSLRAVPVYLHNDDGRWAASLTGDLKDTATELVEIALPSGSARALTKPPPGGRRQCLTKMKDRSEFGYLECNSAFYLANKGSTAAATLIRGVLTLGILTATDVASGNTSFTVSIDQPALDSAVTESQAVALAKESAPLLDYRNQYANASTPQQLHTFITTFEGSFDPESLVAQAKDKLPVAVAQEEVQTRARAIGAAQLAESQRLQDIQRQAEAEELSVFRSRLKPGDRVAAKWRDGRNLLIGMVVEMKPPLAYVQWENATPAIQWVRLDNLLPPR